MTYAGAMGEHACREAVKFALGAHRLRRCQLGSSHAAAEAMPVTAEVPHEDAVSISAHSSMADTPEDIAAFSLPESERDAPPLVFDPFCGHGALHPSCLQHKLVAQYC